MNATAAPRLSATERRFAAVRAITGAMFVPETGELHDYLAEVPLFEMQSRLVQTIELQRSLGRTARWQDALTTWQAIVNEAEDVSGLHWAVFQGAIWAGYAAE